MKLSEHIANCQKALEEYGDLEVITAKDAEGNGYNRVHYEPTAGYYDGEYNGDFMTNNDPEDDWEYNAVCLN